MPKLTVRVGLQGHIMVGLIPLQDCTPHSDWRRSPLANRLGMHSMSSTTATCSRTVSNLDLDELKLIMFQPKRNEVDQLGNVISIM
jgi:hypothetical protein